MDQWPPPLPASLVYTIINRLIESNVFTGHLLIGQAMEEACTNRHSPCDNDGHDDGVACSRGGRQASELSMCLMWSQISARDIIP